MEQLTEEQRAILEASAVPENMEEDYKRAALHDYFNQGMENVLASRSSGAPSKVASTADIKRKEIENYLKGAEEPGGGTPAAQSGLVAKGTNAPVVFKDGKYLYTDPETNEIKEATEVEKISARKAKSKGTGSSTGSKPKKKKVLSEKSATKIGGYNTLLAEIDNVAELKGKVDTGIWNDLYNGLVGTYVSSDLIEEDAIKLKQKTSSVLNKLVKEIAGTAVSKSEEGRLLAEIPTFKDDDKQFNVKLKGFREALKKARADFIKAQGAAGRDVSGFEEEQPAAIPEGAEQPAEPDEEPSRDLSAKEIQALPTRERLKRAIKAQKAAGKAVPGQPAAIPGGARAEQTAEPAEALSLKDIQALPDKDRVKYLDEASKKVQLYG